MMEFKYLYDKILIKDKTITLLDRFVLDFTKLIKPYKHVIVSGYVAIFFGRARGTEDIDVLVEHMGKSQFSSFYSLVLKHDYYFLNPENEAGLYEMPSTADRMASSPLGVLITGIPKEMSDSSPE